MTHTETPTSTLEKIAALLRKAESTDSEHEAEALVQAAQRLSTLHSISLEQARRHVPKGERREVPTVEHIVLGQAGKRGLATYVSLFGAIGGANDVKIDIAHNSTYVVAYGLPSDIDTTKLLYGSLVVQMVEAAQVYIKSGAHKNEYIRTGYWMDPKPLPALTARLNFQEGYAGHIGRRLMDARKEAVTEAEKASPEYEASDSSVALVLADKRAEVSSFYHAKSNAKGSWKGGAQRRSYGAQAAGRTAAKSARLSAPKSIGGSKGSLR